MRPSEGRGLFASVASAAVERGKRISMLVRPTRTRAVPVAPPEVQTVGPMLGHEVCTIRPLSHPAGAFCIREHFLGDPMLQNLLCAWCL